MTVIGTNVAALSATNASNAASKALQTSIERLSTGKRINSAKDDAAGLAIASSLTSQIKGQSQAIRNANDGIALAQTADGALGEVTNILQRVRELAVQSASGTYSDSDRVNLQKEVTELTSQIKDIVDKTDYNGNKLFSTTDSKTISLQTGSNAADKVSINIEKLSFTGLVSTSDYAAASDDYVPASDDFVAASSDYAAASSDYAAASSDFVAASDDYAAQSEDYVPASEDFVAASEDYAAASEDYVPASEDFVAASEDYAAEVPDTVQSGDGTYTIAADDDLVGTDYIATQDDVDNGTIGAGTPVLGTHYTLAEGDIVFRHDGDVNKTGSDQVGTAQVGTAQVGTAQVGTAQVGTAQVGTAQVGTAQVGTAQVGTAQVGTAQVGTAQVGTAQVGTPALSVGTAEDASTALAALDTALDTVATTRAGLGAVSSRLESVVNNLTNNVANLTDARSRIEDVDFSTETTNLAKAQILSQASTALLAQANQSQQGVLSLLR